MSESGPDEAEPEGCGEPTVEGEKGVWPVFRRNPKGRGPVFPISASIVARKHSAIRRSRSLNSIKLAPCATPGQCEQALVQIRYRSLRKQAGIH